jgi:Domain of unknown function (DUF222)
MSPTASPAATDLVASRIDAVADALAALAELPVFALDDARLDARVASAARLAASAQEMLARTVGGADQAGTADRAGCSSTQAWLSARHGMSPRDASRTVAHAAAMTPATEPTRLAWARGDIDGDKAEIVAHAVNDLPDGVDRRRVEAAQADLVARASTMTVRELKREASRLVEKLFDADQAERLRLEKLAEQEMAAYEQATFRGRNGLDGVARFSGTMPNLAFDMLMANLDASASPRRDHLRADSEETTAGDGRHIPAANRLGRALCDLVARMDAKGGVSVGDGVNATIVVTVDEQDLRARVGLRHPEQRRHLDRGGPQARLRRRHPADGPRQRLPAGRPRPGRPPVHEGSEDRPGRTRRRLRVPRLRTPARMDRGTPRPALVDGRQDRPGERGPALRIPPPAHPPRRRLADAHRRRRHPRDHPAGTHRPATKADPPLATSTTIPPQSRLTHTGRRPPRHAPRGAWRAH